MPTKSRRNRRNITKSKINSPISANPEMTVQTTNSQPVRATPSQGGTAPTPSYPFLSSDLKWTGIVTGVIIIILIVAYIIFQ